MTLVSFRALARIQFLCFRSVFKNWPSILQNATIPMRFAQQSRLTLTGIRVHSNPALAEIAVAIIEKGVNILPPIVKI